MALRTKKAPRKRSSRSSSRAAEQNLALNANASTARLNFELQQRTEHPTTLNEVFRRARYYAREISFLQMFLPLKRGVLNFGMKIKAVEKGKNEAVNKWLAEMAAAPNESIIDDQTKEEIQIESTTSNLELISKYVDDAWDDYLLTDNVISLWLDGRDSAITLSPEKCTFSDTFGIEMLKYTHGLSAQQVAQLPEEQQERFKRPTITINPGEGEHFKVLKRSRVGEGFSWPGIFSVFRVLGEVESKEVGQNSMAFCMRKVTRHHKLGHEIKNGERAGKPTHFWNKQRSDAVKSLWVDVVGIDDYTSNFDEEIAFPWPPLEHFDQKLWDGSDRRLNIWGGPLAQMLVAKGVTPYLTLLLKAQALDDRRRMGHYLSSVINLAFHPPAPIKIEWSNMIFTESRLAAEMLKFAVQQGLASATTAKEEIGLNPSEEEDLKVAEVDDPDAMKKFRPLWDASHALAPASGETSATAKGAAGKADPGARPGKPAGTKDSDSASE